MMDRERKRPARPHPELFPLEASGVPLGPGGGHEEGTGVPKLWLNVVDGMVTDVASAPCCPVRGGMLCDEPGLGKTITILALLLRTRGLLPGAYSPPPPPWVQGLMLPRVVNSRLSGSRAWIRRGSHRSVDHAIQRSDPRGPVRMGSDRGL